MKSTVSQFLCHTTVAVSSLVLCCNGADLFFQLYILLWLFLLFDTVIICAARETGNVQQQRQLVFMPQFPYYFCFLSCRTLSATKAFNFFRYAFSALNRCTSANKSSSISALSFFGGRPLLPRPLRSMYSPSGPSSKYMRSQYRTRL